MAWPLGKASANRMAVGAQELLRLGMGEHLLERLGGEVRAGDRRQRGERAIATTPRQGDRAGDGEQAEQRQRVAEVDDHFSPAARDRFLMG